MTYPTGPSLGTRIDSAILNSSLARFSRACAAKKRKAIGRPAVKPALWLPATSATAAVIAVLGAVAQPHYCPAAALVVVLTTPLLRRRSAFAPLPDERELAVHRASATAGFIAALLVLFPGLFAIMAQAFMGRCSVHQIAEESLLFGLLGLNVLGNVPRICAALHAWHTPAEDLA